jgi:hypothetical protein
MPLEIPDRLPMPRLPLLGPRLAFEVRLPPAGDLAAREHARARYRLEHVERLRRTPWGTYVPLPELRVAPRPVRITAVVPAWAAKPAEPMVFVEGRWMCRACGEPPEASHRPMVCAARLDACNERLPALVAELEALLQGPRRRQAVLQAEPTPTAPLRPRGLSGLCWATFGVGSPWPTVYDLAARDQRRLTGVVSAPQDDGWWR